MATLQGTTADAPPAPDAPTSGERRLVAAATALAFVLGLVQLGTDSLWVDDGFTFTHARLGDADFWSVVAHHEMNGVVYSVLMHGWLQLGQSETWLRLPSVLFATAAVPVLWLLGRRLFDERVGVTAAFLIAVNAFVVEYSHEARTYALTLLLATASVLALVRMIDRPSTGRWVAWVALTALLAHAHFFGVLVIGAEVAAVLGRGTLATPRRALLKGFGVIGVLLLPIAWFLASGGDKGQVDAAPPLSPVRFIGVFGRLVGNGGPLLLALVGVAIAVALYHGLRSIWVARGVRTDAQWSVLLCTAWVAVPITTVALLSVVKPLFGARWLLLVAPALMLLASAGVWQIRPTALGRVLLGAIVIMSLVSTAYFYPRDPRDDFRSATAYVLDHAEPGDAIVFQPWFTRVTFTVYADRSPARRDELVPLDPDAPWGDWLLIDEPPELTPERAQTLIEGHDRVWVLERAGTEDTPQADDAVTMTDALEAAGYAAVDEQTFPGLDVTLYQAG